MKVAELMHTELKTISVDATIDDAVDGLTEAQVSAMPVVDRFGRAVGAAPALDRETPGAASSQRVSEAGTAEHWFRRHGGVAVLLARLLPGVRPLIGIPAGIARMPLGTFLLYSALGTVVWTGALAWAGRIVGANVHEFTGLLAWVIWVILGIVAVAWGIVQLLHRRAPNQSG